MWQAGIAGLGVALLLAGHVLAHEGVKNPAVMARMMAMKSIGEHTKTLGQMAKGATAFDAAQARAAAEGIAGEAARTPALFEAPESDPKSEALPAIWQDFEAFSKIAADLETAARDAALGIETPQDLQQALGRIGETCKACHADYRIKK